MYEAFNNARNKNIITKEEFEEFNDIFKEYRKAKGKDKSKYTRQARELYRNKLYNKLKKIWWGDLDKWYLILKHNNIKYCYETNSISCLK